MRQPEQDVQLAGLANSDLLQPFQPFSQIARFFDKTLVIAELEVRKLRHDPTELITRAVQPALWLLVFGEVFTRVRAIPTGNIPYIDFMSPGILAQSVLFISIFYGIAIIWERDLGIVHKFLVSPTPRAAPTITTLACIRISLARAALGSRHGGGRRVQFTPLERASNGCIGAAPGRGGRLPPARGG